MCVCDGSNGNVCINETMCNDNDINGRNVHININIINENRSVLLY